jgi:hypothetical protein
MHPKLKKISPQDERSDDPRVVPALASAPETPNVLTAPRESCLEGVEAQGRNAVTRDKFAYLRAQVRIFRRAY